MFGLLATATTATSTVTARVPAPSAQLHLPACLKQAPAISSPLPPPPAPSLPRKTSGALVNHFLHLLQMKCSGGLKKKRRKKNPAALNDKQITCHKKTPGQCSGSGAAPRRYTKATLMHWAHRLSQIRSCALSAVAAIIKGRKHKAGGGEWVCGGVCVCELYYTSEDLTCVCVCVYYTSEECVCVCVSQQVFV